MTEFKRCKKCLMTNTRPHLTFNEEGVCQACQTFEERQKIDWAERWVQLEDICRQYRGKGKYDCMITMSGGKDSHFQVGLFKEKLGMNPLGFMIDNGSWTDTGRKNFYNLSERFGIDILTFTIDVKEAKERAREDFLIECWPAKYWDSKLYNLPMEFATMLGIKLVIWGENIYDIIGGKDPVQHGWDTKVIYTSDYVPWSRFDNVKYAKENGFSTLEKEWNRWGWEDFPFEQVDTIGYLTNLYCKFIKFGFAHATEFYSDMIRQGLITREEGLKKVLEKDWKFDPIMERDFCNGIGITSKQFWEMIDKFANKELLFKSDECHPKMWMLKEDYRDL